MNHLYVHRRYGRCVSWVLCVFVCIAIDSICVLVLIIYEPMFLCLCFCFSLPSWALLYLPTILLLPVLGSPTELCTSKVEIEHTERENAEGEQVRTEENKRERHVVHAALACLCWFAISDPAAQPVLTWPALSCVCVRPVSRCCVC